MPLVIVGEILVELDRFGIVHQRAAMPFTCLPNFVGPDRYCRQVIISQDRNDSLSRSVGQQPPSKFANRLMTFRSPWKSAIVHNEYEQSDENDRALG